MESIYPWLSIELSRVWPCLVCINWTGMDVTFVLLGSVWRNAYLLCWKLAVISVATYIFPYSQLSIVCVSYVSKVHVIFFRTPSHFFVPVHCVNPHVSMCFVSRIKMYSINTQEGTKQINKYAALFLMQHTIMINSALLSIFDCCAWKNVHLHFLGCLHSLKCAALHVHWSCLALVCWEALQYTNSCNVCITATHKIAEVCFSPMVHL